MDKLEEQGMKKISSIKQNVIREKRKIIRDKLKDKRTTWTLFETEKEKEDKKKWSKMIIKDKIIIDIRTRFKQKKNIKSLKEWVIFGILIISRLKVIVIKIETYH